MLIAERIVKVYGRTDGGPGAALAADGQTLKSHNAPKEDTPCRWWNMVRICRGQFAIIESIILQAHQFVC